MKNIDNNLNKYFESARNFKSPISVEKARLLIENVELNNELSNSFLTNKGKIIMTTISMILISFFLITNQFNLIDENKTIIKNEFKNNSENLNQIESKTDSIKSKKSTNEQHNDLAKYSLIETYTEIETAVQNELKNSKIQGINTIQLTESELLEFGIKYFAKKEDNSSDVGLGFWSYLGPKAAMEQVFYSSSGSEHRTQELPLDSGEKFIQIYPNCITDYKGVMHLGSNNSASETSGINEFEPFSNSLNEFLSLEFDPDIIPLAIPNEIVNKFAELKELFSNIKQNSDQYFEIAKKIDLQLKDLHRYYSAISNSTDFNLEQNKAMQLTPEDSNLSTVMAVYMDKKPNEYDFAWRDSMAKLGVKLVFAKHPFTMRKYLESNFNDLSKILFDYQKKYKNYVLINKFVAIVVPFKNSKENDGLIFWYYPSQTLINALPERFRESLSNEFKLFEKEEAICGAKINSDKLYLDVWRACNGAIENLRIFPNPIQNEMHVKYELKDDRVIQYELYDIDGNKIEDLFPSKKINSGSQTALFDFQYLKAGMYLFVVRSNIGEYAVQRFIKE